MREAQARQELENDGCPPCCSPGLDIPLRHIPGNVRRYLVDNYIRSTE